MNKQAPLKRIGLTLLAVALAACGSGDDKKAESQTGQQMTDTMQTEPPATAATPTQEPAAVAQTEEPKAEAPKPKPKPAAETKSQPKPATTTTQTTIAQAEPEPAPKKVTIPAGASVNVALQTRLQTDSNQAGDKFSATTVEPITVDGATVVPSGWTVMGRLTEVEEPHRTKGHAKMTLLFESLVDLKGQTYAVETMPIAMEAEGDKISDEAKVGAGAVIGGVIGALASKKKAKGAAIGTVAGAAAGGAAALATKGKQLVLEPGQKFSMELAKPVEVSVAAQPQVAGPQ